MNRAQLTLAAAVLSLVPAALPAGDRFEGRDLDNGARLYAQTCAVCHGADLEGQADWRSPGPGGVLPAPPHDETGHTWHHDTQLLLDYTQMGGQAALAARGVTGVTSGMPAFGEVLSTEDILDVLAFIRSTWPAEAQQVQAQRTHGVAIE
ncbi:c-type cytochrome [Puniceibacterium confluentis]|uniref:c-type cytochrome n=1 Tax=Puniceibacterium confluentis TaxID=1958944 RepID=UPI0011B54DC2|nr:cytochrome c [Puniceibacterium confluentis]